jgi:hypothetical protein
VADSALSAEFKLIASALRAVVSRVEPRSFAWARYTAV